MLSNQVKVRTVRDLFLSGNVITSVKPTEVIVTQQLSTGTPIAVIDVNGLSTQIYSQSQSDIILELSNKLDIKDFRNISGDFATKEDLDKEIDKKLNKDLSVDFITKKDLETSLSDINTLNSKTASQATVVSTLNKMIEALKKISNPIVLIALLFGSMNIFGGTNIKVFDYEGTKVEHDTLVGGDEVYKADEIDKILNSFNGKTIKRYPVFCVDLNTDLGKIKCEKDEKGYVTNVTYENTGYSTLYPFIGFELKASTNNFRRTDCVSYLKVTNSEGKVVKEIKNVVPGLSEEKRILYWCASEMGLYNFEQWDSNSMLKFGCAADKKTKDLSYTDKLYSTSISDYRSWKRFETIDDLENIYQGKIMVILDFTKFKHTPDTSWCNSENKDLVWSYIRTTQSEQETDDSGNPVWRPIMPIMWLDEIPSWAYTNNEVRIIHESQL